MKNVLKMLLVAFAIGTTVSCSSDDDSSSEPQGSTFKIDGMSYDMSLAEPNGGVIQIINGFGEDGESTSQIMLAGANEAKMGSVVFHINFMEADGISGTYLDGDTLEEIGVFDSETSLYNTSEIVDGSQQIEMSEGAEGTFKITHNNGANYTIEFNVTYDDGTVAEGSVTQDFIVQEI